MDPIFNESLELVQECIKETRKNFEDFFRNLQQMQPEQIERNRRMMKAGLIMFDDYEEVE